jgi:hypothetical protein
MKKLIDMVLNFFKIFGKKEEEIFMINWNDPKCKISKYFTVHEATFLPSWRIYHLPSDEEKVEIVKLAKIMDKLREKLNKPFIVHVWMRPKKVNCAASPRHGQDYNLFIGSKSTKSGHIFGQAVDFHVSGMSGVNGCNLVRQEIMPLLEPLNLRMEDIQGGWVHIDTKEVSHKRFFKP